MHIKISTSISFSELDRIKSRFTRELFLKLNPPFPPVKLLQFDGCQRGDKVILELNFIFFRQKWISHITQDQLLDDQWFFIDEGVKLPFFLKRWNHKHIVLNKDQDSRIVDDIFFSTGTILGDLLMYPVLYAQFLYRKPIYKKWFKKTASNF